MKAIGVKNLRGFKEKAYLELKTINIFLGRNSSGKSSFLRLFPLFKQSIDENAQGPVLFNGKNVDYGTFKQLLSNNAKNQEIHFYFDTTIKPYETMYFLNLQRKKSQLYSEEIDTSIELVVSQKNQHQYYTKEVHIRIKGKTISINFNKDGGQSIVAINSIKLDSTEIQLSITKHIFQIANSRRVPLTIVFDDQLDALISSIFSTYRRAGSDKKAILKEFKNAISLSYGEELKNILLKINLGEIWKKNIRNLSITSHEFRKIEELVTIYFIRAISASVEESLSKEFLNVRYIKPLRADAQRDYKIQDISVSQIDPNGSNLAMFILNLNEIKLKSYQDWLSDNFGFTISLDSSSPYVELKIQFNDKKDEHFNLADLGFGYSQVLPIMTQLWFITQNEFRNMPEKRKLTLVVEQPELHLHPAMQYELAKVFANIVATPTETIDLKIILETHSEVFVNTMGIMIAKQKLSKENVSVSIFEYDSEQNTTTIKKATYDDDGGLDNWPYGFFKPDFDEI